MNNVKLLGKEEVQTRQPHKFNSVGEILKYHRELKGLSLEKVARNTYIKLKYLAALEENLPDVMPAPVYVYSYIKHYSKLLGLDGNQLVKLYQGQFNITAPELPVKDDIIPEEQGCSLADDGDEDYSPVVNANENFLRREYIEIEKEKMELKTLSENKAAGSVSPEDKSLSESHNHNEAVITSKITDLEDARLEAEKILEHARAQAERILTEAREEAFLLKNDARTYAENVLLALEHDLGRTIEEIKNGRSFLRRNRK